MEKIESLKKHARTFIQSVLTLKAFYLFELRDPCAPKINQLPKMVSEKKNFEGFDFLRSIFDSFDQEFSSEGLRDFKSEIIFMNKLSGHLVETSTLLKISF